MTPFANVKLIPNKAQYKPRETVQIQIIVETRRQNLRFRWSVYDLHLEVRYGIGELQETQDGFQTNILHIPPITNGSGAYGVFVTIYDHEGNETKAETAFDVAEHWREAPRYGFLSDFAPSEKDESDVDFLNRNHINLVQFYDWMYRHDQLLTDQEVFTDPLGRTISFPVIRRKMNALRDKGIASIAYAAVYASLPDYAKEHPEQVLYQNDGIPYRLGNYFYIMDISPDSAWTEHIVKQFQSAARWGFDGLQLDQYGFPKKAIRKTETSSEVVELKHLYPALMNRTREALPATGIMFNDVGTYPLHTTALAEQDVVYIEVWDPVSRLKDLQNLIRRARGLSGKQVVLAAYLPAFLPEQTADRKEAEAGAVLAMASIFASGGYHISLGEHGNILADPYFPKYGSVSEAFAKTLTRYYDFIVMYRHLLYDHLLEDLSDAYTGGINNELKFSKENIVFTPDEQVGVVWTTAKEKPGFLVIHLINLLGVDNDIWHAPKKGMRPTLSDIEVSLELVEELEGIYWCTPDGETIAPLPLEYEWVANGDFTGQYVRFTLPRLECWTMIYVQTKHGAPARCYDPKAFPS